MKHQTQLAFSVLVFSLFSAAPSFAATAAFLAVSLAGSHSYPGQDLGYGYYSGGGGGADCSCCGDCGCLPGCGDKTSNATLKSAAELGIYSRKLLNITLSSSINSTEFETIFFASFNEWQVSDVEKLDVSEANLSYHDLSKLQDLSSLKKLTLRGWTRKQITDEQLVELVRQFPALETIDLKNTQGITTDELQKQFPSLSIKVGRSWGKALSSCVGG